MSDGPDDYQARARELLALIKDYPSSYVTLLCRSELLKLQQKGEKDLNHLVKVPFGLACHLKKDFKAWTKYINTPDLWKHRKKPRRDKDHGRVLNLVFEATLIGLKGYGPCWYYARALEDAFIKDIQPEDLPAYIEANGSLKQMYQAALRNNPRRKPGRDFDDPYFDLSDPKPEATDESKGGDEGEAGDPGPKPDTSTDEPEGIAPDARKPSIEHSAGLRRKLEKIIRDGRGKNFLIAARLSGDGIVLRLPKKVSKKAPKKTTNSSGWSTIKILPDQPDEYYDFYQDYYYGGPTSTGWTTCKPWEHPSWKR